MNVLDVKLQFLWLTELLSAQFALWSGAAWVCGAPVGAVHVQVVQAKETLEKKFKFLEPLA